MQECKVCSLNAVVLSLSVALAMRERRILEFTPSKIDVKELAGKQKGKTAMSTGQ